MKFCKWCKDGGPESYVDGLFLIEIKGLFSVVLLRFRHGTREIYHSHAFNSISWLLKGKGLVEYMLNTEVNFYQPSLRPIKTYRRTFHKVRAEGTNWVLSFRGPWSRTWSEYDPVNDKSYKLSDGRVAVPVAELGNARGLAK